MGRLDRKVIVLSAAAQGIGRAAAIVMNFNKTVQRDALLGLLLCLLWKQCMYLFGFIAYLHVWSPNMTILVPSWISSGQVTFIIGAAKCFNPHFCTPVYTLCSNVYWPHLWHLCLKSNTSCQHKNMSFNTLTLTSTTSWPCAVNNCR